MFRASTTAAVDAHADRGDGVMHPLDLAAAYLRRRASVVVGWYAAASAPLLVSAWLWVDAVSAEDRTGLRGASVLLVAALLWRWVWLVPMQAAVMRDAGMAVAWTGRRVAAAVLARLAAHALIVWGGLLIFPGFLGFYVGSFAPVLLLGAEQDTRLGRGVGRAVGLTWSRLPVLLRHTWALLALMLVWALTLVLSLGLVVGLVMPSLLGLDTTDVQLAMGGPAWWLGLGLLGFLVLDLYWQVAAVFTVRQLEAQRSGGDLFARLAALRARAAEGDDA